MLTGQSPLYHINVLSEWVQLHAMQGILSAVFDYAIHHNMYAREMLQLAGKCVAKEPDLRPSMDEVVMTMKKIASGSK